MVEGVVLAVLTKVSTDVVKVLSKSRPLNDVSVKVVAYILALVGTILSGFHIPTSISTPVVAELNPLLTAVIVGFMSQVVHDVTKAAAKYASSGGTK